MRRAGMVVIALTGLAAGCGDDGDDGGVAVDGPGADAPDVDAATDAATDAPDVDAPIDAPAIDGPIDAPPGPQELHYGVTGSGAGVIFIVNRAERCATASCVVVLGNNQTITLRQVPIAGSTFTGWTGCTPNPDGTCTLTVNGIVTAGASYTAPPPVEWVRSASWLNLPLKPIRLAAAADGVVASGTGYFFVGSGGAWLGRYLADGTAGPDFLDDPNVLHDHELATAVGPSGQIWVLLGMAPATQPGSERFTLHRLSPTGAVLFQVLPGGDVSTHGLAVDGDGDSYVSGNAAAPYLASYDLAGVQRWRITPAGASGVRALALRDGVLIAAGDGWMGAYDLAGAERWTRTVGGVGIAALAIDSDGDVVYGGAGASAYVVGAIAADGQSAPWQTSFAGRTGGAIAVRPNDAVRVWAGSATSSATPSILVDLDESGAQTASETITTLPTPGGLVIDGNGATFMSGPDYAADHPAVIRRP